MMGFEGVRDARRTFCGHGRLLDVHHHPLGKLKSLHLLCSPTPVYGLIHLL